MIKAGILGSHENTDEYLSLLKKMKTFDVVGIHEENCTQAIRLNKQHGIKLYTHPDELLEDVDALFAAPSFNTFQCLSNVLRKSKHLFIDPPVYYNSSETKQLIKLSDEANVIVQVGYRNRFNPALLAARPLISPQVRLIHCYCMKEYNSENSYIHPINDLMIQDIDNILGIVQSEIKKISAYGMSTTGTKPDVANAIIEFHNGCVASLTASTIAATDNHQSVFYNKTDYITIDILKNKVNRFWKQNTECSSQQTSINKEIIPVRKSNELKDELSAFSNCIEKMSYPEIGLENASKTIKIVNEINTKIKLTSNCL